MLLLLLFCWQLRESVHRKLFVPNSPSESKITQVDQYSTLLVQSANEITLTCREWSVDGVVSVD